MAGIEHVLERRSHALAERLKGNIKVMAAALQGPGGRPPWTEQLSKPEALRFWQQNRYTDLGRQVLANMKPEDVMDLDRALAAVNEQQMYGGEVIGE